MLAMVEDVRTRSMKTRRGGITEVVVTDGSGRLVLTFQPALAGARAAEGSDRPVRRQGRRLPAATPVGTSRLRPAARRHRRRHGRRVRRQADPGLCRDGHPRNLEDRQVCAGGARHARAVPDPIPPAIRRRMGLMDAESALRTVHRRRHARTPNGPGTASGSRRPSCSRSSWPDDASRRPRCRRCRASRCPVDCSTRLTRACRSGRRPGSGRRRGRG